MSKKITTRSNSTSIFKITILFIVFFIFSFALNCFTLYKLFNSQESNDNSSIQVNFTSHFVTSSEVIKSKTYYIKFHYYDQTNDGGKMHACVYDAYDKVNNNSSEIISFQVVLQASDGKAELNLSAYSGTTWANWCNSSFNRFTFENQIVHFAIADDGHIIFGFDTN